jgi:hypothetical protein
MITKIQAILSLVPNAQVVVRGEEVEWYEPLTAPVTDNQINAEVNRLQAQAEADAQAVIDAKQSALSKLTALGLTQDEVKALLGVSA